LESDSLPRRSLDSSLVLSIHERRKADWPEDHVGDNNAAFEDVKLNEEDHKSMPTKKRGFFLRLGTDSDESPKLPTPSGIHLFAGRKRAQSNQGAEMASMPQPSRGIPAAAVAVN
jgi:hypothetical protein